jgi:hypothetical protein
MSYHGANAVEPLSAVERNPKMPKLVYALLHRAAARESAQDKSGPLEFSIGSGHGSRGP